MKALPLISLLALCALSGAAADARPPEPLVLDDLTFASSQFRKGDPIEIRSSRGQSTVSLRRTRFSGATGTEPDAADGLVRFTITADAGRTDCEGTRHRGVAIGRCRFVSTPAFEAGLAERGVDLDERGELVTLALVDARLTLVDELSRDGFVIEESGDLVAATALGITGAWAHEVKGAGLTVNDFSDLIAARARCRRRVPAPDGRGRLSPAQREPGGGDEGGRGDPGLCRGDEPRRRRHASHQRGWRTAMIARVSPGAIALGQRQGGQAAIRGRAQ